MSDFERFEAMVTPEMIRAATEALGPCVGSCGEASPPDSYDIRCAIAAALAASHVPAGYKLVPVEPTREMLEAARDVKRERLLRAVKATQEGREPNISGQWLAVREEWDAMLDAAPTTPNGLTESETLATASVAGLSAPAKQAEASLDQNELYRLQMAAISTAALGYWKLGDPIKDEYVTVALKDVASLYEKYDALFKASAAPAADDKPASLDSVVEHLQEARDMMPAGPALLRVISAICELGELSAAAAPNGPTESAAPVPAPAQQVDAYTPEFLERARLLAGRLRGTDWCKPDLRAAATLLEEFYLTATAALAPSVEAPAQQAERECRHCGWLCRPNPAESQRWYPLTDPALKESQR